LTNQLRIPPHSEEAERGVLGSILLAPMDSLPKCAETGITSEAFYDRRHQALFEAVDGMDGERTDALLIAQVLADRGLIEKVGGYDYLIELQDATLVTGHIESYIEIVLEKHMARQLIEQCSTAIDKVYEGGSPDFISMEHLSAVDALIPPPKETMLGAINEQLALDEKIANGEAVGLPLPWSRAQRTTHGIPFSTVTPLAGRDGKGKSRLATFLAKYWVVDCKIPILYFPFEDTTGRFLKNFAATMGGYDAFKMNHNPSKEFRQTHSDCMLNINKLPLYVHDIPSTGDELTSLIYSHKKKYGVRGIVIDGWKDIIMEGGDSTTAMEGALMAKLILAAKKTNTALIPVMHLRDIEDEKWISKREIRGNKQLTQSSRMTMLYQDSGFPDSMANEYGLRAVNHAVLDICKCSYGYETIVPMVRDLERGRFIEIQRKEEEDARRSSCDRY